MRTRNLIELGELITKAELDHLPINTLYGALLSLQETINSNDLIKATWAAKGNTAFNQEKENKIAVILKFEKCPNADTRDAIREQGFIWNGVRQEWYGYVTERNHLEQMLQAQNCKYKDYWIALRLWHYYCSVSSINDNDVSCRQQR